METMRSKLTVYFEDPFWVGVYERETEKGCEACKIVFGAEPKDYQVYCFFIQNWHRLRFSPSVAPDKSRGKRSNPKRARRDARELLREKGVGTKAQRALKLQREQNGLERRKNARERLEEEKERRFNLRQAKKKEKRKGH